MMKCGGEDSSAGLVDRGEHGGICWLWVDLDLDGSEGCADDGMEIGDDI